MKRANQNSKVDGDLRAPPLASVGWLVFLAALPAVIAAPVEINLPEETVRLVESPLPGYPLAVATCSTCHSADYVKMQPVSSRTYWKNTVTKMQKTYAAPIPEEMVEPLVDYLVKTYGNERTRPTEAAKSSSIRK